TMPTAAELGGDFSQSIAQGPVSIFDPATGQPFPGNVIPSARIDPAAQGLLSFIPPPNSTGSVQNYQFVTSVPRNTDNFSSRVSHTLSSRDSLSVSFNLQQRASESARLYGFRDATDGAGLSSNVGWTRAVSSTVINSLRVSFSRNRTEVIPEFSAGSNVAADLGIQGTSQAMEDNGPPNLSFTNFGGLSAANASLRRNQSVSLAESVTWIRGKHNFRFGFDYRRNQRNTRVNEEGRGSFSFSGLLTSGFDEAGSPLARTGFDMADLLLGFPQSASVRFGESALYFRGSTYSAHIQDDFRAAANFSINFGVRYEYTQPLYEKFGRMSNLDFAPGFSAVTVMTPGTGDFPRGLVDSDKNNIAPRIGIAWRPWKKKSLRVRAGYGVYFNGSVYNQMASRLGQQPPFAFATTLTTSISNPLTLTSGLLGSPTTDINNTLAVARDYMVGYAQTWNLSLQQDLPFSLMVEAGYLGTKGTRLDIQRLPNQAPPGSPLDSEDRRPIPNAVGFTYESADGNSIYHAGQVRLTRRFRRGLSFNLMYAFSKSIDNVSSYGGGQAVVVQNDKDLAAERGLSSFDQRHALSVNFMVASPVGQGPSRLNIPGVWGKLLEDWTFNGGITAHSGNPLTAVALGNRSDAGGTGVVGSGRADSTGLDVNSGAGFFNTAAFTVPPSNQYGNAGRNTVPGPNFFMLNTSVGRSFPVGNERRRLEFRIEANNVLNSVNFTRLGTTVNASNFGLATGASSMRSITAQVSIRF
ncbi:MAG: TonB-dependent receptor, partial [bacterium]|nr:TonB-dependent receptor [bacterium]